VQVEFDGTDIATLPVTISTVSEFKMLMNAKTSADHSFQYMKSDRKYRGHQKPLGADLSEKLFSIIASSYTINKHIDF